MSAPLTLQVRLGFSMGWRIWSPNEVRFYAKTLAHSIFILKILKNKLLSERIWVLNYAIFSLSYKYIIFLDYLRFGLKKKEERVRWHSMVYISLARKTSSNLPFIGTLLVKRYLRFISKKKTKIVNRLISNKVLSKLVYRGKKKRNKIRSRASLPRRKKITKKKKIFIRRRHSIRGFFIRNGKFKVYIKMGTNKQLRQRQKNRASLKKNSVYAYIPEQYSARRGKAQIKFSKELAGLGGRAVSKKLLYYYGGPYSFFFRKLVRAHKSKHAVIKQEMLWFWQKTSLLTTFYSSMEKRNYW